jgi:NADPH:quinone reductase-like Zn-dependent oxidoreductase
LLRSTGLLIAFGLANANVGGKRRLTHVLSQIARTPFYTPMGLMTDNRGVAGVNMAHLWHEIDLIRTEAEALSELYREGKIRPHIGASYPFSRAADAHRELESGRSIGKVVLLPD